VQPQLAAECRSRGSPELSGSIDWYAARAAGVVAYVLLTSGVVLGTALSGRARLRRWPAFAITDVHRFVAVLSGVFIAVHVLAISLDTYTPFSLVQIVVPGASSYRPLWVALGIVSAELLAAIAVTNVLRTRLPYRLWRRVHYLTFAVWAGATVHGLGAGTDAGAGWLRVLYSVSIAAVVATVAWRVAPRAGSTVRGVTAAALFGLVVVLGLGLLPHGLGATRTAKAATSPPSAFADSFSGSVQQRQGSEAALVSVVGRGSGSRPVLVRIDLVTDDGETITDTSLQVRDLTTGTVCSGTVSSAGADGFSGTCTFPGGTSRSVSGTWQISGRSVQGSLRLRA